MYARPPNMQMILISPNNISITLSCVNEKLKHNKNQTVSNSLFGQLRQKNS